MKSSRAQTEPRTATIKVRFQLCGKDPFDEKEQKEKRGEGKPERGQEEIIDDQGQKGRQNPLPGIGLGKKEGLACATCFRHNFPGGGRRT